MVEAHTQEAHTPVWMIFPEIGSQGHAPVQIQCRSSKLMGPMVEAHTQEAHTEQEAHTPVRMIFPEIGS
ncbi:hypothetical protein HID58_042743 [Brassica napus]|uniref:Uncharacterized protein n=1 Tax=Brassica napus TaxID=3708 RepID=A0ABQ8BEL7_BRANA|nr:hypothetical protein HID58_042743 [Brassica napus]